MIRNISMKITDIMYGRNLLKSDELDMFCYGMEIIISSIINVGMIIAISLTTRKLMFGIIFLLFIVPIRMITGGFHAKTYICCSLVFSVSFVLALLFNEYFSENYYKYIGLINCISSICYFRFSPMENRFKPLTDFQIKTFKTASTFIFLIGGFFGIIFNKNCFIKELSIILLIVTILFFLGKGEQNYEKGHNGY